MSLTVRAARTAVRLATSRTLTDVRRWTKVAHTTLYVLASCSSTKKPPNPAAASRAKPVPARPWWLVALVCIGSPAVHAASTTPRMASTMPISCQPLVVSPRSAPTATGITAPVAEMGAAMLTTPIAMAR